jgi:hypothetical protein
MTASEQEMKDSLRQIHKEGVFAYAKEQRTEWLEDQLGMVVLAATQVQCSHYWSSQAKQAGS